MNLITDFSIYKKHIGLVVLSIFLIYSTLHGQVGINTSTPQGILHIDPQGNTDRKLNADDDVIVTYDGKVGVGTLNPDIMLTVKGDIAIGDTISNTSITGEGPKLHFLGKSGNTDPLYLQRYNRSEKEGDLLLNIGDQLDYWPWNTSIPDYFVVGVTSKTTGIFRQLFWVRSNGSIGMGKSLRSDKTLTKLQQIASVSPSLEVHGTIRVKGDIKIRQMSTPSTRVTRHIIEDINQLKKYIEINKHLPNIPSEEAMLNEGVDLAKLQMEMLQIIKQLTIYTKNQYEAILRVDSLLNVQSNKIELLKKPLLY